MPYGIRTAEVEAFTASLANLRQSEWGESVTNMVGTVPNLFKKLDAARIEVDLATGPSGKLTEYRNAQKAVRDVVFSLPWSERTLDELYSAAELTAGAIIVMDQVEFEEIATAFEPFRGTSVKVPVNFG